MKPSLSRLLPALEWGREYHRGFLASDLLAAVIVTIMLIPQSLAYALLAGLPAEMGLYASILPLIAYALFGTSRTLSVGPVAVASLMTATAVGNIAVAGTLDYATAAIAMAMISGLMLLVMGAAALRFPCQLSVAPGGVGVHHRLGHHHRAEPVAPHTGY